MPSRLALGNRTKAIARFEALLRVIARLCCMRQRLGFGGSSVRIGGKPPASDSAGFRGRSSRRRRRDLRRETCESAPSAAVPEAAVSGVSPERRCARGGGGGPLRFSGL